MEQFDTDVAVIGSGPSGMAAAITAAEKGARTLLVEKGAITGGTGNMAMGPAAVESRLQKEKNVSLTKDQAFKLHMDYTHWRVDAQLVRKYIDLSGDTISWLEEMGVNFFEVETQFDGAFCTHHNVQAVNGGAEEMAGTNMMKAMDDQARRLGVTVMLRTKAVKVLKDDGSVIGLIAEEKTGKKIRINARSVIIGTGGFGTNPEMVREYTRYRPGENIFPMFVNGIVGEGIRMAWEAGAARSDMTMQLISSLKPPYAGRGGARKELAAFRQPNLLVNLQGERFMNEEILANTTFSGNAIFEQKNSYAFIIFDEDTKRHYEKDGMHFCDEATVEDLDANIDAIMQEGCDCIFVADSLEELAGKAGINVKGLKCTVDEYNKICDTKHDHIMNKRSEFLRPIRQPKFYAGMHVPSAYGSLGGIKINHRAEVLDDNSEIIPGLFAVGTDANAINGVSYVYIMPGSTLAFALNSGRIAGETAAIHVSSNAQMKQPC